MITVVYLAIALVLLFLNAIFVLAEFAAVKIRHSRIEELMESGDRRAHLAKQIHDNLDEYLSVCQVGITFASIGLGFVAEPAVVRLIEPIVGWVGLFPDKGHAHWFTSHGIAFVISYLLVSFLHILVGELLPKSIAIRHTDSSALLTAAPLKLFRWLFIVPLAILNSSANVLLRILGLHTLSHSDSHSENELRILLDQSQAKGLISFRRLLFMENVFDLGELQVRDAMRVRSQVRCLFANRSWSENLQIIRNFRFTRYPLVADDLEHPAGIVHLKDLLMHGGDGPPNLLKFARPLITTRESAMLESLLADMQRKRIHAARVVDDKGNWTGFLTLEDVIEEIVGTIRDEFEDEEHIHLIDAVQLDRIHVGIEASGPVSAVQVALDRMKQDAIPLPKEQILKVIDERERAVGTYLGRNIGMPHARMRGLQRPFVMILRSRHGIPYPGTEERATLLFVLLTPAGQPRVHQRLQAVIATILDESEYVPDRLQSAESPAEILEIIRTAEQATLD